MKGEWLTLDGSIDRRFFDGASVKIKTKMDSETSGLLAVETVNEEGQIILSASYNSSPFPNTIVNEVFCLTQKQLNELVKNGASCILAGPRKNPN